MPTLCRPLVPEFFADDVREDWEFFAMTSPIKCGNSDYWASADLAGIGDMETASDLFDVLYFGA